MIRSQQEARKLMGSPYGKATSQLVTLAIRHWREWRPKYAARMEKENRLRTEALKAAKKVQKGRRDLLQGKSDLRRFQEAEEEMLRMYILLPPEKEVLEEMEREE